METEEVGKDITARWRVGDMKQGQTDFMIVTSTVVWMAKKKA